MKIQFGRTEWLVPVILLVAGAIIVWAAPAERTMGHGIKVVYIHVALMWAGMAGLMLAGVLGIGVAAGARMYWHDIMEKLGWVSLGLFMAGVVISFLAAKINWGAVSLQEPRTAAGITFSAIALIVKIGGSWLPWPRVRGAFNAGLVALVVWSTVTTPLVLHPKNPVGASSSTAIQWTFGGLSVLTALLAAWMVWYWQTRLEAK